jgi:phosphohistidine swiveling domain-containing protein
MTRFKGRLPTHRDEWRKVISKHASVLRNEWVMRGQRVVMKRRFGREMNHLIVRHNEHYTHFTDQETFLEFAAKNTARLESNPRFMEEEVARSRKLCEEFIAWTRSLRCDGLSGEELLPVYWRFVEFQMEMAAADWVTHFIEILVDRVRAFLAEKIADAEVVEQLVIDLAASELQNANAREELAFLELVIAAQAAGVKRVADLPAALAARFDEHVAAWFWLHERSFEVPWGRDEFAAEFARLLPGEHAARLQELKDLPGNIKKRRAEIIDEYDIPGELQVIIDAVQTAGWLRTFIRNSWTQALLASESLFGVIRERMGLSKHEWMLLREQELVAFLEKGELVAKEALKAREGFVVYVYEHPNYFFYEGEEAERVRDAKLGLLGDTEVKELAGTPAFVGTHTGKVKLVFGVEDASKVEEGDVLVTRMTTPDLVFIMRRAGAIVTDEGGLLCHAAIVSRELGVPCVVGTDTATKVFQDGELVEVDAGKGVIRKK